MALLSSRGSHRTCGIFRVLWWYWHLCSAHRPQSTVYSPQPAVNVSLSSSSCSLLYIFLVASSFYLTKCWAHFLMTFDSTCCLPMYVYLACFDIQPKDIQKRERGLGISRILFCCVNLVITSIWHFVFRWYKWFAVTSIQR